MPDFEIRYYAADGKLVLVRMCAYQTVAEAEQLAQKHIGEYARFEIVDRKARPAAVN